VAYIRQSAIDGGRHVRATHSGAWPRRPLMSESSSGVSRSLSAALQTACAVARLAPGRLYSPRRSPTSRAAPAGPCGMSSEVGPRRPSSGGAAKPTRERTYPPPGAVACVYRTSPRATCAARISQLRDRRRGSEPRERGTLPRGHDRRPRRNRTHLRYTHAPVSLSGPFERT
jgi:hypothetical protein